MGLEIRSVCSVLGVEKTESGCGACTGFVDTQAAKVKQPRVDSSRLKSREATCCVILIDLCAQLHILLSHRRAIKGSAIPISKA